MIADAMPVTLKKLDISRGRQLPTQRNHNPPAQHTSRVGLAHNWWDDPAPVYAPRKITEALQGVLRNGIAFLVTLWSTGGERLSACRLAAGGPFEVRRTNGATSLSKTVMTCRRFMTDYDISPLTAGSLVLDAPLKEGGGEALSSIDQTLTLLRLARSNRIALTGKELYRRLCESERSDLPLYPEHLQCCLPEDGAFCFIGRAPAAVALRWDSLPGRGVSTEGCRGLDARRKVYAPLYEDLLAMVVDGDVNNFCRAVTISAAINEQWLPHAGFPIALKVAESYGCGCSVSHTGTFISIIMPLTNNGLDAERLAAMRNTIRDRLAVEHFNYLLIGGQP